MAALLSLHRWLGTWVCSLVPISHLKVMCLVSIEPHFSILKISKLRHMLSLTKAEQLVNAFMSSRLDYCNDLQGGCPARLINKQTSASSKRSSSSSSQNQEV